MSIDRGIPTCDDQLDRGQSAPGVMKELGEQTDDNDDDDDDNDDDDTLDSCADSVVQVTQICVSLN